MSDVSQRVLIVDDEPFNIKVLSDLLSADYKIMVAKSGEQALKAARGKLKPDLVLLDIMMPEMSGYEVCEQLKADDVTKDIPVIFVTAMGQTEDEAKGFALGAVDYVTKPVSPSIVQARVKTHLALRKSMVDLGDAYVVIESQKDRMQEELDVGREIQESMIPDKAPESPGNEVDMFAYMLPAREVGGDFFDYFYVDENHLCFCVGDVSGKGVPAALFMAMAKVLIKSRAKDDSSIASILTHVNDELSYGNEQSMFVTMFAGILDIRTGETVITNAGHNPSYIKRANGEVERLKKRHGIPLGPMDGMVYEEEVIQLNPQDRLLVYTDGVSEAMSPDREQFREGRLEELFEKSAAATPEGLVEEVFSAVKSWEDTADQFDDITVMALDYHGKQGAAAPQDLDIRIKNDLAEIVTANNAFNEFVEGHGVSKSLRRKTNIVFDELLNNIISYAYGDEREHFIDIHVELSNKRLIVSLADDGMPFNPLSREEPDTSLSVEEREIGGLGIHIVRNLFDKVTYQRKIDRNNLTLVKNIED